MQKGRRDFIRSAGTVAAAGALGPSVALNALAREPGSERHGHVVVIGAGYGGATAAKYIRMWSEGKVKVTLIERRPYFTSCPISNLVIGGLKQMPDLISSFSNLRDHWGIELRQGEAVGIDAQAQTVRLADGEEIRYDRLVVSPGVDFLTDQVEGLAGNETRLPHAWKAGEQTVLLRRQLEAMPDGGVFAMHIPRAPYRCPPGPYERACMVANYFKREKPRSKVLVLDSNADIESKTGLFHTAFDELYPDIIEYRPDSRLLGVNAATRQAELEFDSVQADVLNVIPPQRAGRIIDHLDIDLVNNLWVEVDFLTMETRQAPNVHVLGDATLAGPGMPKSGHMANQHAKVAAAAIVEILAGREPNPSPVVMNTCFSFVDANRVMHVSSVHQYDQDAQTLVPVEGAGGLSDEANEAEGEYALAWARNIWADMLT